MAQRIIHGRYTAEIEGDFVVLLIGARINSLRGLRCAKTLPPQRGPGERIEPPSPH